MKELLNNVWNAPAIETEQALLLCLITIVGFFAGMWCYMKYTFNKRKKEINERFKKSK